MFAAVFGTLIAALLIFYAGKQFGKKRQSRKSAETAKRYFKGLSYVLNEQPDKAIDLFVELIKVDDETVETHFALGNLYRQRGETERAIRIHQNIFDRPALPEAHRSHAQYELGLDYFHAGILDRAESIFTESLSDNFYRQSSLKNLLQLYQQTQEWEKAVKIANELRMDLPSDFVPTLSHFYCELAENEKAREQWLAAIAYCDDALSLDPSNVRPNLIAIGCLLKLGDIESSERRARDILKQNANLFPEILPFIDQICANEHSKKELLLDAIASGAGAPVVLAVSSIIQMNEGDRAAGEFLAAQLRVKPSVRELQQLVRLHMENASGSTKESLQLLSDVLERLSNRIHRFRCARCGFHGTKMYWRCPTCKTWNSVKPSPGIAKD